MKILFGNNTVPHKFMFLAILLAAFLGGCTSAGTNENANLANVAPTNSNSGITSNSVSANAAASVNSATTPNAATTNAASATNLSNTATAATVGGSPPVAIDPDVPNEAEQQTLIKTTLLDLDSAIRSGGYESFHSSGSAYFQQQYSPAQLEQKFGEIIKRKIDLSGIASKQPAIKSSVQNQNGIKVLNLIGSYPTNPAINFELQYIQEDIEWKLLELDVK